MSLIKDHLPLAYDAFKDDGIPNYLINGGDKEDMNYTPDSSIRSVIETCTFATDFVMLDGNGLRVWMDLDGELYARRIDSRTRVPHWMAITSSNIQCSIASPPLQLFKDGICSLAFISIPNGYLFQVYVDGCATYHSSIAHARDLMKRADLLDLLDFCHYLMLHETQFGRIIARSEDCELCYREDGYLVRVDLRKVGSGYLVRKPRPSDISLFRLEGTYIAEDITHEMVLSAI